MVLLLGPHLRTEASRPSDSSSGIANPSYKTAQCSFQAPIIACQRQNPHSSPYQNHPGGREPFIQSIFFDLHPLSIESTHNFHLTSYQHVRPQPNMPTTDIWVCCQCGSANAKANAPEQCPVCSHPKCSCCKCGRPTTLFFMGSHYSLPKAVDMELREVIGAGDGGDVELGADIFMHGDEGLVQVTKQRGA